MVNRVANCSASSFFKRGINLLDKIIDCIKIFVGIIAIVTLLYGMICIPFFWKFDRMFRKQPSIVDFGIPIMGIILRTISYTMCVVFPKRANQDRFFKITFDGYDFRKNTNVVQKILSYISVALIHILMLFTFILALLIGVRWFLH